jgi:hypothetical protein
MIFFNPYFVYDYMLKRNPSVSRMKNNYQRIISVSYLKFRATNHSYCRTYRCREYMTNENYPSFYSECRKRS